MMGRWLLVAVSVLALPLFGNEKKPTPPPFDADLYRRDTQVYSFHGFLGFLVGISQN